MAASITSEDAMARITAAPQETTIANLCAVLGNFEGLAGQISSLKAETQQRGAEGLGGDNQASNASGSYHRQKRVRLDLWGYCMKMEPGEVDFELLKTAVANPKGIGQRALYWPLVGQHCESFLWQRVKVLVKEKYLTQTKVKHNVLIFPTAKTKQLF